MFVLATTAATTPTCTGDYASLVPILTVVKFLLQMVQWIVPIILIVLGTIDLVKAVIAGKDDDIKKHQQTLIKRVIAAVIVFLVPMIVSILMGWLGNKEWKACWASVKDTTINGLFTGENMGVN